MTFMRKKQKKSKQADNFFFLLRFSDFPYSLYPIKYIAQYLSSSTYFLNGLHPLLPQDKMNKISFDKPLGHLQHKTLILCLYFYTGVVVILIGSLGHI